MEFYIMNHQQATIRQQAYREAVRKAGSVAKLSKRTNVSESKITYRNEQSLC